MHAIELKIALPFADVLGMQVALQNLLAAPLTAIFLLRDESNVI